MNHYDDSQWVDYVRGVASTAEKVEIEQHLAAACPECASSRGVFETLSSLSARAPECEPPAPLLRSIRAHFSLWSGEPRPVAVEFSKLDPANDSFTEPIRTRTDSRGNASRQLVYYGHDYALSLRVDYDSAVSLGGELVHRKSGPVPNVPTLLMSGHTVLGYSTSGELGDFRLSCREEQPMRLRLLVNDEELIEIDLDWPAEQAPA